MRLRRPRVARRVAGSVGRRGVSVRNAGASVAPVCPRPRRRATLSGSMAAAGPTAAPPPAEMAAADAPAATSTAPSASGRTFDGQSFRVPVTHDLLEMLARRKTNAFDVVLFGCVFAQVRVGADASRSARSTCGSSPAHGAIDGAAAGHTQWFLYMTGWPPRWLFMVTFMLWRTAYNGGLGLLLHHQSEKRWFSQMTTPWLATSSPLHAFLRRQLTTKMGPDYDFDVRSSLSCFFWGVSTLIRRWRTEGGGRHASRRRLAVAVYECTGPGCTDRVQQLACLSRAG